MPAPLMKLNETLAFLTDLRITLVKAHRDYKAVYKGYVIGTVAIRHGGEKGIKLPYVWKILREKLKVDGLIEGSKEYDNELRKLRMKIR